MAEPLKRPDTNDPDIKEIRDEFTYAKQEKRDIVEEGATDMRAIAGDVWDPTDRKEREDAGRPCLSLDELNQYVNQLINGVRQNKRAIRVSPQGRGATPKTADFRRNLIRQIEYRSNAQQAYASMFENTAQRSYGYLRVVWDFTDHESFEKELLIKGVPNPDLVWEDPNAQRTDGGDWQFLYFAETWTHASFKRRFPRAQVVDFESYLRAQSAGDWLTARTVLVAERWRIVTKERTLLLIQPAADPRQPNVLPMPYTQFRDELQKRPLPPGARVLKDRAVDYPQVKKQITNGLEILEEIDCPGTSIPFVACYGKVLYLDEGSGPKKQVLSLIRLARDPLMLYCYYRTQQAEIAGMIPKTPIGGYKGQFAGLEGDYQKLPHEPLAFIEANFTAEGWNPGWGPMPLPQRLNVSQSDHLQALEMCAEGARRAIQAAIGISPLPTQAQRRNEKSGVALQQIESAEQRGSFHFVDHYDDALMRTGVLLDEYIEHVYPTPRDVTVRNDEDQPDVIRINDPQDPESVSATEGQHDVTIGVGPYEADERESASNFADTLLSSQLMKFIPPPLALKLSALAVRLKGVGPIGDQIADLLSPKEQDGPQGPDPAQMQAQLQAVMGQLQDATQKLATEEAKQRAQVEIKRLDADLQIELQTMKNAAAIRVAEIAATKETALAAREDETEAIALGQQQAFDAAQAERDRLHEAGLSAMTAEQQAAAQAQSHGQQLEAGDIEAQRAAEQAEAERAAMDAQGLQP